MIYKRGSVWWFCFEFAGQRIRESTRTSNKAIARQAERHRHQQLERAANGIVKRAAPKQFAIAAKEWLSAKSATWKPKTYQAEELNVRHLLAHFGGVLLIDINAEDVSIYQKARLGKGAAPKTANLEIGTLRAILKRHRLWADLAPDVSFLRADREIGKALTRDEEARLLEACAASRSRALLPFVTIAFHTGMRRGEIQSLRWRQIDFLDRTVTVGESKTSAGTGRVIPLNQRALSTFQVWAANFPDRRHHHAVFPSKRYGVAGNGRTRLVYAVDPEKPIGTIKTAWSTAKHEAGVQCRFHDTRHSFATRVMERGASLSVVSAVMGWSASTTAMMAKRYGHIGAEAQRKALDTLVEPTEPPMSWGDSFSPASRS